MGDHFDKQRKNTVRVLSDTEKQHLWSSIQLAIVSRKARRRVVSWVSLAGAASLLLAVGMWWLFPNKEAHDTTTRLAQMARDINDVPTGASEKVQLTLGDGRIIQLEDESTISYHDSILEIHQQGAMRAQHQLETDQISQYHTLHVPFGKRTEVVLPDGSTVWLNAGSALTFPAVFASAQREVYLVGEGYFDVKHQADHPFTVHTKDMQINVLGTSFNICAYDDDAYTAALLLKGSIALKSSEPDVFEDVLMKPGNKATFDRAKAELRLVEKGDEDDISWTKKQLMLRRKSLPEIIRKMERVYNAKIDIMDRGQDQTFSGSLDVSKPIVDVLAYLYPKNEYSIAQEERRIIIRRK